MSEKATIYSFFAVMIFGGLYIISPELTVWVLGLSALMGVGYLISTWIK